MQVNKRILISIGILGAATLLLYGAAVIPSIYSINKTKAKIANEHSKIERRYMLRSVMRKSLSSLEKTRVQLRQLSAIAVHEGRELEFINALEKAAADSDITLDIVLESVNQKDISLWEREIPLRLVMTGDYLATIAFMNAVDHLPYSVIIDNINIRSLAGALGPESIGSSHARTEISGTVYWLSRAAPDFLIPPTDASAQ